MRTCADSCTHIRFVEKSALLFHVTQNLIFRQTKTRLAHIKYSRHKNFRHHTVIEAATKTDPLQRPYLAIMTAFDYRSSRFPQTARQRTPHYPFSRKPFAKQYDCAIYKYLPPTAPRNHKHNKRHAKTRSRTFIGSISVKP